MPLVDSSINTSLDSHEHNHVVPATITLDIDTTIIFRLSKVYTNHVIIKLVVPLFGALLQSI